MKILIIEDEKHNASRLQRLLTEISASFEVVGVLETVRESVEWFNREAAPDVVLMDIRLADGLSFDIFEKVDIASPIIFTTSYDEYAVRAFKVNSIDYLLKPIEKEELLKALNKIKIYQKSAVGNLNFEQLLHLFKERTSIFRKRFLLPKFNGYKTVVVDDIDYIFSEFKITYLQTRNGDKEVLEQTMEELEDELNPDVFFRANRQFIVSINSIAMIQNSTHGKLKIILKNNRLLEIVVSREKAPLLKKWLNR